MPKNKDQENALIIPENDNYFPVLAMDISIKDILEQNLGGEALEANLLPSIRVPSGGGTTWEFETADGIQSQREISGLIVHTQSTRQYWKTSYDDNPNQPPDCSSADGLKGHGDPGGSCLTCPFNKYGSKPQEPGKKKKSKAKACQEKRILFTVLPKHALPHGIVAPTMSLKGSKQYLINLAAAMIPSYARVTSFTLETGESDGIKYSKIILRATDTVPPEQLAYMEKYVAEIKPFLKNAVKQMAESADFRDEATEAEFSTKAEDA